MYGGRHLPVSARFCYHAVNVLAFATTGLPCGVVAMVKSERVLARIDVPIYIESALLIAAATLGAACGVLIAIPVHAAKLLPLSVRAIIASCLRRGTCPACGYQITGQATETDGCATCPECGAAWRLSA
jgi:hypothetical protein